MAVSRRILLGLRLGLEKKMVAKSKHIVCNVYFLVENSCRLRERRITQQN